MKKVLIVFISALALGCAHSLPCPPCNPEIQYQTVEVPVPVVTPPAVVPDPELLLPAAFERGASWSELLQAMQHDYQELLLYWQRVRVHHQK